MKICCARRNAALAAGAFLRLPTSRQLARAIEKSSFEELARQEAAHGFVERPETAEKFFRKGETGQWREALTENRSRRWSLRMGR